ncbi:hypothetical protein CYY_009832 [Polysphondylium violaceum]|uniref:MYND-type domain-containing protein n=1 Tax=Polysphondylium violaceum TaxID=133409 RepID=A0A8J4PJM3_9MYCE|nr:hypothetical protein CYY_009832 [Polysphondylium violaceum]
MKVSIGYAEEPYDQNELTSDFFPNKVGGKPAWLDQSSIPKREELKCSKCSKQLSFLLQINAPIDGKDHCYHRTIHLFCCLSNECKNFVAIRTQLPQVNEIYPVDADERKYEQDYKIEKQYYEKRQKQCEYCGLFAAAHCAGCNKVSYCCKEHQTIDWDLGHREQCKILKQQEDGAQVELPAKRKSEFHFKEYEILNEDSDVVAKPTNTVDPNYHNENDDDDVEDDDDEEDQDSEANQKILEELMLKEDTGAPAAGSSNEVSTTSDATEQLNEFVEESGLDGELIDDNKFMNFKDQEFLYFKRVIAQDKNQILRYSRDNEYPILWVSEENKVTDEEIGKCPCCNGDRRFEFQVLPQLLYFILDESTSTEVNNNELDFGILNIYTCENSCEYKSNQLNYVKEFIFKQDFTK